MDARQYLFWTEVNDRSLDQYVEFCKRQLHCNPENLRILHAALGLSGEAGELSDSIKKSVFYERDFDLNHIKEECGDVLWYMARILQTIGSDFEEVMALNHEKLTKRYNGHFSTDKANARVDKLITEKIKTRG